MAFALVVATNSASAQSTGGQPMFSAPQSWLEPMGSGGGLSPIAVDLDGDQLVDFVYKSAPAPRVRFNLGSGSFSASTLLSFSGVPPLFQLHALNPVGSGDFNFDGFLDLVFVESTLQRTVWIGIAQTSPVGTYTLSSLPNTGITLAFNVVEHVTVDDFNGDGSPEVLVAMAGTSPSGGPQDVLNLYSYSMTSGGFGLVFSHPVTPDSYFSSIAGDFNGDGIHDIAFATCLTGLNGYPASTAMVHLLFGAGNFTFAAGGSQAVPMVSLPGFHNFGYIIASAAGDVDADGHDDFVGIGYDYTNPTTPIGLAYVFRGSAAGLTAPYTVTAQGSGHWQRFERTRTSLADIDGDGFLDLMGWHGIARLWPQNVTGPVVDPTGGGPYAPFGPATGFHGSQIAADFDGDGDLDVFVPFTAPFIGVLISYYTAIAWNQTRLRYGCAGGFSPPPVISTGTLYLGNPAYEVRIDGAPPNALCVFGIATAAGYQPFPPCVVGLDLSTLIQPTPSGLGFSVTNASGSASQYFAIPALPALQFAAYYGQWIVVDPGGQLSAGPLTYNLTETRKFVFW